jgi:hypothetical protein
MKFKDGGFAIILCALVFGSFMLATEDSRLRGKFIDLASTGLGGYLALAVQGKGVNTIIKE